MIKQLLLIGSIAAVLFSCCKPAQHQFLYSNGNPIEDSAQIDALEEELKGLIDSSAFTEDLHIQTTFSEEQFIPLQQWQKLLKDSVVELQKGSPAKGNAPFKFKIAKDTVQHTAIIILNNNTGEVEHLSAQGISIDILKANIIRNSGIKLFGTLLAFDKGKELQDTFLYEFRNKIPDLGYTPLNMTIAQSFTVHPGGNIQFMPYSYYPLNDWKEQNEKLHNNMDLSEFRTGRDLFHKTSIFDLVKTFAIIQNDGKYIEPRFITTVKSGDGKILYTKQPTKAEQVLNTKTVKKMQQLLDYNKHLGAGILVLEHKDISEENLVLTAKPDRSSRYYICLTPNYTIGIFEKTLNAAGTQAINIKQSDSTNPFLLKEVLKQLNKDK